MERFASEKENYLDRKEREKRKRKLTNAISKYERLISDTEEEMAALETEIAELDYSNQEHANSRLKAYEEVKLKNDQAMTDWETAQEELDLILSQE